MSEYTIQQGENLTKIASRNNTTVQALASLNKISDVNKISAGQRIQLTPSATVGLNVNSKTTQPNNPMQVVQPQPNVKNAVLQSDLISQGQQATQKALQDELAQAQKQGTPTDNIIRNILASGTTTPPVTPTMPTTASNSNGLSVNGVTQDSLNTQKQGILDMMSGTQGEVALTNAEFANTVDPARQELNTINAEMNTESLAGRRRIESVMNIPGITKEQAQDKINEISRTNTSKLADLAVIQMAVQGKFDSAKEIADRSVQAKLEVQKNKRDAMLFMYTENKELFTKTEQRQFETSQRDRERKLNAEEKTLQRVSDLSIEALKNGASTSLVTKMQNAKTEAEAIAFGGQFIGLLDRQDKILDRKLKNAQIGKIYADMRSETSNGIITEKVQTLANQGSTTSNREIIASILTGKTVSTGTKGRLAPATAVMNAIDEFTEQRQSGVFIGMGFGGRIKESIKGIFNVKNKQAIENRQNIDGINLKVQQWASGANLSEQQTEQVNKLTPKAGDSDKTARIKFSGLYNYMLNQVESELLTDGVNINFASVNLFENRDLLQNASPEQLAELKAQELIQ